MRPGWPAPSAMRAASPWEEWAASTDSQNRIRRQSVWLADLHGDGFAVAEAGAAPGPAPFEGDKKRSVAAVGRPGSGPGWGSPAPRRPPGRRGSGPGRWRTARRAGIPWCRRWGPGSRIAGSIPWRRPGRSIRKPVPHRLPAAAWPTCSITRPSMAACSGSRRTAASSSPMMGSPGKTVPQGPADQGLAAEIGHGDRAAVLLGQGAGVDFGLDGAAQPAGLPHGGQGGFHFGARR